MDNTQSELLKGAEYLRKLDRPTDWDKILMYSLIKMGISVENAGTVVGMVAEERMNADRQGYCRGYDSGFSDGKRKYNKTVLTANRICDKMESGGFLDQILENEIGSFSDEK